MKRLFSVVVLVLIIASLVPAGCSQQTAKNIRLQDTATRIQRILQSELNSLDADLATAAKQLSTKDLAGPEAKSILLELCQNRPYIVDTCTIDSNGKMVMVEPEEYNKYAGSDISGQEQVIKLLQTRQPVFSHSFKAVEGFYAVDLENPVFSANGELRGSVSALIKPEVLFDKLARPVMDETSFEKVWAMQKDGRIIYDYDSAEIGTNLFTGPLYQPYTELLTLGKQISERETGCGKYQFLNLGMKEPVKKQACWSSLSLHGTQWSIIVVQVTGEQ